MNRASTNYSTQNDYMNTGLMKSKKLTLQRPTDFHSLTLKGETNKNKLDECYEEIEPLMNNNSRYKHKVCSMDNPFYL